MNQPEIQTIILDLGGVIINLDIDHAFDRFSQLFGKDVRSDLLHDLDNHRFFLDYELGHINDERIQGSSLRYHWTEKTECLPKHLMTHAMPSLSDIPEEKDEYGCANRQINDKVSIL
ncbi:MAG: hypothetical protein U5K79_02335 [Cyclobacteriaceae bacterium]|nr:hypothetical protein [Cyclobacteriaceae bacterium]